MLAFSPFQRVILHASGVRLALHEPSGTRNLEFPEEVKAICATRELVLVATGDHDRSTVWKIGPRDRGGERVADVPHTIAAVTATPSGNHALVRGGRTSRIAIERGEVSEVGPAVECGVVFEDGSWVGLAHSTIELHEGGEPRHIGALMREGRFVSADALGEPGVFVFMHNQPTHSLVQHINVRTRVSSTGLLVPLSSFARVARQRRVAILWSTANQLVYLLDLRSGRLVGSRAIPPNVVAADIDAAGSLIAFEHASGELSIVNLQQFLAGATAGAGAPPPAAAPAPVEPSEPAWCEPEPAAAPPRSADAGLDPEMAVCIEALPAAAAIPPLDEPVAGPIAELFVERAFDLIAALAQHAIASAWSCGRLAFHGASDLPYESEVAALLQRNPPRAVDKIAEAKASIAIADRLCSFLWKDAAIRPGPMPGDRSLELVDRHELDPVPPPIAWPLRHLAEEFGLSPVACDILIALMAPGGRPEFARLYAFIRNDPGRPLCDEMLLCQLLEARVSQATIAAELEAGAPLLRHALVRRGDGERIFAALTVDPAVMARMRAMPLREAELIEPRLPTEGFWIAQEALPQLERALEDGEQPVRLVLRGRRGSGRRTLAAMIARAAGRACVHIDACAAGKKDMLGAMRDRLVRAAILGQVPVVSGIDEPDTEGELRAAMLRMIRGHHGPVILRGALDWTPGAELRFTTVDLPRLSETGRRQVWQHRLARVEQLDPDAIDALATRHAVGPASIVAVASRIPDGASPAQTLEAIEARLASARESRLGTVATKIGKLARWGDVVLPDDVGKRIDELIARVKFRRQVYETWGFQKVATTALGITALFQGGPGTGKTLVAGAIARQLDYELYRVDVSRIVSKWIGETEKNLSTIFDNAEDGRLVLLFDEADTLFAKRTEVKSSVDRYANSEVNFLLQRLDSFHGVAILTTNRPGAMDPAFQRRLSMAVAFPEPDEDLRERIWAVHIPQAVPRDRDLDLAQIARSHQFSGGHIRNAVMRALFFAASDGVPLRQDHLVESIRLEYQNLGKLAEGGAIA